MTGKTRTRRIPSAALLLFLTGIQGCDFSVVDPVDEDPGGEDDGQPVVVDRYASIPSTATKVLPADDPTPPILHTDEFQDPVPLPVISTAGAEDSPFIPADRDELYFYFAADPTQSANQQIYDPANGIWVSKREGGTWQEPTWVQLQDSGELALNGCPFVEADTLYFCSARVGYFDINWFTAVFETGMWDNWNLFTFDPDYVVGELHIHGDSLYYHSERSGGVGGVDIWMLTKEDGQWVNPVNVAGVNSTGDESRPYLTPDGKELWITRTVDGSPALFRSKLVDGEWQEPEIIVSQFAGEATLDSAGNLYFVHHFLQNDSLVESDIYVAYKK